MRLDDDDGLSASDQEILAGAEPTSRARPAADLCVFKLRFRRSGIEIDSKTFVERFTLAGIVRLRSLVRNDIHVIHRKRLVCALCGDPLNIAARAVKHAGHVFYFAHPQTDDPDKAGCPFRSKRPNQKEIEAWRYHGQRESPAHRQIKARIARCLALCANVRDIKEEEVWTGRRGRRRPDVSATLTLPAGRDVRLAFEAQLSATFVSTIVERQAFYRAEGALLAWILRKFDPSDRRMMVEDIVLTNNRNALVVNEETEAASIAAGTFMLEVHWHEPVLDGRVIAGIWRSRLVRFDELPIPDDLGGCFYFDADARERELKAELTVLAAADAARAAEEATRARRAEIERAAAELTAVILDPELHMHEDDPNTEHYESAQRQKTWYRITRTFAAHGATLPHSPKQDWRFNTIVKTILSARSGHPVGWGYKRLVEVPHLLANQHPYAMPAFASAAQAYGRKTQLAVEDKSGKWQQAKDAIWQKIRARQTPYIHDDRWDKALAIMFPEVFARDLGEVALLVLAEAAQEQ